MILLKHEKYILKDKVIKPEMGYNLDYELSRLT
jgi:hypothetical protein